MQVAAITKINDAGIIYQWYSEKGKVRNEGKIEWGEIFTADAFKRDMFAVDLVCLQLKKKNEDEGIEVDEEDPNWSELMDTISDRVPGFKPWGEWFSEVAFPAFETNLTRVYERNS